MGNQCCSTENQDKNNEVANENNKVQNRDSFVLKSQSFKDDFNLKNETRKNVKSAQDDQNDDGLKSKLNY